MIDKYEELLDEIDALKRQREDMAHLLIDMCRHSDGYWNGNRSLVAEYHYQTSRRLLRASGFKYEPNGDPSESLHHYLATIIQEAWHRGRFTAIDLRDGKAIAAAILEAELLTKPPSEAPA